MNPSFELSKSEQLFLLVEGACIPDLERQLYQLPGVMEQEPIFLYPPYNQLLSVSPRLVKATPEVQHWFFDLNQFQWGYFFSSDLSLSDAAKALRRLIMVEMPSGNPGFFRFADSHAAYVLLDTQCAMLWQPMNKAWIHQAGQWQRLENPFVIPPEIHHQPLKITDEQWRRLSLIPWQNSLPNTLIAHMQRWFPERCQQIHDLRNWVCSQMDTAYAKGFETEQDLLYYFNILGYVGEQALLKNTYPNLTQLIEQPSSHTSSQRIVQAASLAEQIANQSREN
ncbi:DUF4123 domain-containing protein [Vibrio sp. Hep-1b-8]|uniref:DUF4123 domain-containing protein n=2 Tax=unclassified Vibrio TaxID=2614977 RepID=UPI00110FF95F|nr:DUF4123 domain-containing protein [Vibrio sp. Hep-1b-8]TMX36344.1 DUF4123 domain-containing protein [Vibrio sp. Hep-1b-8]